MASFRSNGRGDGSRSTGRVGRSRSRCAVGADRRVRPDGGLAWNDLTGFQRDLLTAIQRCAQDEEIPTGQAIKARLEAEYGEEINNGRLYQNLGHLVDSGLLNKGFVDGRTNTYSLNSSAAALLDETAQQFADICGLEVPTRK